MTAGMFEDEEIVAPKLTPARARGASESAIVAKITKHLRALPLGHAVKVHGGPYGNAGEPDLNAVVNGRSLRIEVKRPGYKPTDSQMAALRRWQAVNAVVGWACSVDDVNELLEHVGDLQWKNPLTAPGDGRQTKRPVT